MVLVAAGWLWLAPGTQPVGTTSSPSAPRPAQPSPERVGPSAPAARVPPAARPASPSETPAPTSRAGAPPKAALAPSRPAPAPVEARASVRPEAKIAVATPTPATFPAEVAAPAAPAAPVETGAPAPAVIPVETTPPAMPVERSAATTADAAPVRSEAGGGVLELVHPLREGLLEVRVDGRRAALVRIDSAVQGERTTTATFIVGPGAHRVTMHVLSIERRVDQELAWDDAWTPGEVRTRRLVLTGDGGAWRVQDAEPSTPVSAR